MVDNIRSKAHPRVSKAVALVYDPLAGDCAPRLVGKGSGELAERIIAMAEKNSIPIQTDPGLVGFLLRVDLEERIPPELYAAVASVLALVWSADRSDLAHRVKSESRLSDAGHKPG